MSSVNDFTIKSFVADYYLQKTDQNVGKIVAKESITAEFPNTNQNHGITRTFLTFNKNGMTADKNSLNLQVTRNGNKENIAKWASGSDYLTAYFGSESSYVHGTQEYVLDYQMENVVTQFSDSGYNDGPYQELYWNTNGTATTIPTDYLEANLHLPGNLLSQTYSPSCYVGRYGSNNQSRCTTEKTTDGYKFSTSNLNPGENLTFAVAFKGTENFTIPEKPVSYIAVIGIALSIILGITLLLLTYKGKWQPTKAKRNYAKHTPVPPQYIPKEGYTVAEMAEASLENTRNPRVATLLELAVNHKIEFKKNENGKWSVITKNIAHNLTSEQDAVLKILNGGGAPGDNEEIIVKRHSYSSELKRAQDHYDDSVIARLKQKGDFESGSTKPNGYSRALGAVAALVITGAVLLAVFYVIAADSFLETFFYGLSNGAYNIIGTEYLLPAFAFLIISIIISISITSYVEKYNKRTLKGLELDNYLKGMKLYIKMAEQDRLNFLQSVKGANTTPKGIVKLYERLLPYAALFGLEKSWMQELSKYYENYEDIDHSWYYGAWAISDFNSALRAVSASSTSGRVDPSSSSSGSGGGGFSGGGGGGGGVGGW